MKLKDFMAEMPTWTNAERPRIRGLLVLLCPITINTLKEFQQGWDYDRPYTEFVQAQNAKIAELVALEMSDFGRETRAALGLPPLTDDTEVSVDEWKFNGGTTK